VRGKDKKRKGRNTLFDEGTHGNGCERRGEAIMGENKEE
jgi:hypothetical protein